MSACTIASHDVASPEVHVFPEEFVTIDIPFADGAGRISLFFDDLAAVAEWRDALTAAIESPRGRR